MIDKKLRDILRAWLYFGYSFQMFCHEEAAPFMPSTMESTMSLPICENFVDVPPVVGIPIAVQAFSNDVSIIF